MIELLEMILVTACGVFAILITLELTARAARYRRYRKLYPEADRGRVWKHVR